MATKSSKSSKSSKPAPKAPPKGWKRREQARGSFWAPWADAADVEAHSLVADNPIVGVVQRFRTIRSSGGRFDRPTPVVDLECDGGLVTVRINGNMPGQLGTIIDRDTGTIVLDQGAVGAGETVSIEWIGKDEPSKQFPQGVHQYDVLVQE